MPRGSDTRCWGSWNVNPGGITQGTLCRAGIVTAVTKLTSPVLSHSSALGGLHTRDFTSPLQWRWMKQASQGGPRAASPEELLQPCSPGQTGPLRRRCPGGLRAARSTSQPARLQPGPSRRKGNLWAQSRPHLLSHVQLQHGAGGSNGWTHQVLRTLELGKTGIPVYRAGS